MPFQSDAQRRLVYAKAHEGEPWARKFASDVHEESRSTKRKYQPAFGNGGKGHGRRQKDDVKKVDISKSRFYDPEARRQRRLGMAEAALAGGGLVAGGFGVRGAIKTTKLVRGKHPNVVGSAKEVAELKQRVGRAVSAKPRELALLGGGAGGVGGAVAVRRHAESRRGHPYN